MKNFKKKKKRRKIERKPKPKKKIRQKTEKNPRLLAPYLLMGRGPNSPR
jgi:hypothetical protein